MKKYRFHLLALAHLPQHKKFMSCAFTQKNRKMARFLTSLGHTVYFYGAEGSDVEEYCQGQPGKLIFVQTHSLQDIWRDYGDGWNLDPTYPSLNYDFYNQDFRHDLSSDRKQSTSKFYATAIQNIQRVKRPDDFLLCTQGQYHKPIADAVRLFLTCESGIGYRGWCEPMFHAFESPYIQNFLYGSQSPFESLNGRYYDRVIPNYFDPDDITFSDVKDDYYLFVGRMIRRKGVVTAYLATKHTGNRLLFAGQGAYIDERGYLVDNDPREYEIPNDSNWEYIGFADVEKRKKLMSRAKAVFTPTEYLECFAGVHVEAMLSGTPVITTDFGVYPYTIPDNMQGKIGFRCNTLQDFVDATQAVRRFTKKDYRAVRNYAERYLMDNVKYEYQRWFDDLYKVYESSVNGDKQGWHRVAARKRLPAA